MSGRVSGLLVVLGFLVGGAAAASEPPSATFAGFWRGQVEDCGAFTLSVTEVQHDGAVLGSVDCPGMGIVRAIGRAAIRGKQVRGWIEGRTLRLEGELATAQVTLDANRLVGFAKAPLSRPTLLLLVRQ
jgi:hypothetical protein